MSSVYVAYEALYAGEEYSAEVPGLVYLSCLGGSEGEWSSATESCWSAVDVDVAGCVECGESDASGEGAEALVAYVSDDVGGHYLVRFGHGVVCVV